LGTVHSASIGISSVAHLDENLALANEYAPRCPLRELP
jgi:predicted aldo/keto reductase-like oxidoreductase